MARTPAAVVQLSSTAGSTPAALEDPIEQRRRCAAEATSAIACLGDTRVAAGRWCTTTERAHAATERCIASRVIQAVCTAAEATAMITRPRSAVLTATESALFLSFLFSLGLTLPSQKSRIQKFLGLASVTSENNRSSAMFPAAAL